MNADRASATALLVALSVVRKGRAHGLPTATMALAHEALQLSRGGFQWLGWLALSSWGRQLLNWAERFFLPGLAEHHCQRKRAIMQQLRSDGCEARLVFLGVGFDALGCALACPKSKCADCRI